MTERTRSVLLVVALIAIAGAIGLIETFTGERGSGGADPLVPRAGSREGKASVYSPAKELAGIAEYINTPGPFLLKDLVGKKVILLDFWTYSCINCQRTLPYLRSWHEKYADEGFEIIGVHTPEFSFEKKGDNVRRAIAQWRLPYPVVLDNEYATWNAYGNRYWPQKYLIDIDGFVVYEHIGEGAYEETERRIQEALRERREVLKEEREISGGVASPQDAETVDFAKRMSPEIYFGAARNSRLGGGEPFEEGLQKLSVREDPYRDIVYLDGTWRFEKEFAENETPGRIVLRFRAGKIFLVAESAEGVDAKIRLDGELLTSARGEHVNERGEIFVKEALLYRLAEGLDGGEHVIEIEIGHPGLRVYTFTFGS